MKEHIFDRIEKYLNQEISETAEEIVELKHDGFVVQLLQRDAELLERVKKDILQMIEEYKQVPAPDFPEGGC